MIAPWVVAGDVAHTRSTTSNLIAGALALLLACAAAVGARDKQRHMPGEPAAGRSPGTMPRTGR